MLVLMKKNTYVPVIKLLHYFIFALVLGFTITALREGTELKKNYLSKVNIAAVVNNKIISTKDISDRIKFIGFIQKVEPTVMRSEKFKKQVLEQLSIDEELEPRN